MFFQKQLNGLGMSRCRLEIGPAKNPGCEIATTAGGNEMREYIILQAPTRFVFDFGQDDGKYSP
jgi:hypothetical protein